MKHLVVIVLVTALVAGCIQGANKSQLSDYPKYSDFQILNSSWAFEDQCQYGNASVGYVDVSCTSGLKCEIYVNGVKSNYSDGLQPCGDELVIAEIELNEKPDFITIQSGKKYFYTKRNVNKLIEICCSYLNSTTNELNRDYEMCQTTRLDAQCLDQVASGFGKITMLSWELQENGSLSFKIRNDVGQSIVIRKIYINSKNSSILDAYSLTQNQSTKITVTGGPTGSIGNNYGIGIEIEYSTASNPDIYFNSTGTVTGTYS